MDARRICLYNFLNLFDGIPVYTAESENVM